MIPAIGFALTFDVNIFPMFRMANRDLLEDLIPEEQKKPRWQRYNLDVLLLAIGLVEYALLKWFPIRGPFDGIIFLIILLAPFAIVGIFLGFSLFVSRMFAPAVGKFSDFIWIKRGNLFALATRNMRQTRFTSSKFVAFTLFALMLGYALILLPANISERSDAIGYYYQGADVSVQSFSPFNSSLISNISSLPEVEGTTVTALARLETNQYTLALGVNHSTFADVAYWRDDFADRPINELMDQLGKNSSNVLVHTDMAQEYDVNVGDPLFLQGNLVNFEFTVVGTFDYFPALVTQPSQWGPDYLVMNLGYLQGLNLSEISYSLYINLKSGVNATEALEKIGEIAAGFSISSPFDKSFDETIFESISSSVIQSSLILTIAIITVSSLFYSFITLSDRKREIAIFRALGMKERQIFTLLAVETLTIMIVGIVLGSLAGYILNDLIVGLLFLDTSFIIPVDLIIPWNLLLPFNIFVIAVSLFSAAFPARRIARVQTGSILRAE